MVVEVDKEWKGEQKKKRKSDTKSDGMSQHKNLNGRSTPASELETDLNYRSEYNIRYSRCFWAPPARLSKFLYNQ